MDEASQSVGRSFTWANGKGSFANRTTLMTVFRRDGKVCQTSEVSDVMIISSPENILEQYNMFYVTVVSASECT